MKENTLRWFGNVERLNKEDTFKKFGEIKLEGNLKKRFAKEIYEFIEKI